MLIRRWRDKRVTVVGRGAQRAWRRRSCCVARGARGDADGRAGRRLPRRRALRGAGRRARARRPPARDLHRRRPRRAEPGRAARTAGRRGRARARRAGDRRDRAGVALAEGPRDCDHRHQGQVDDDHADRTDARGVGRSRRASAATSACRCRAQVDDSTPDTLHVVEASSFQLETTDTFHPWIAVLLNFSPDHLDRHPTVEAYAAAKARIFRRQRPTTGRW